MTATEADQIAALLNERNQLVVRYDRARVLSNAPNYLFRVGNSGRVVACLELKEVQWYQFEICHVTVAADSERKGLAADLLKHAEAHAVGSRARVLQCTIREDNASSQRLFEKCGFAQVSRFYNVDSGNYVGVWQKVLSVAP